MVLGRLALPGIIVQQLLPIEQVSPSITKPNLRLRNGSAFAAAGYVHGADMCANEFEPYPVLAGQRLKA